MPSRDDEKDEKANPFIAFRKFADEQMSNLVNSIFSLSKSSPSSNLSHEQRLQEYHKWLEAARQSSHDIDRESEEARRIMDVYMDAQKDFAHTDIQPPFQFTEEPLRCPYRPQHQQTPSHDDHIRKVLEEDACPLPIGYLLYNQYSPLHLERQADLCKYKWREAYEDLARIQIGSGISQEHHQDHLADCFRKMVGGLDRALRDQHREGVQSQESWDQMRDDDGDDDGDDDDEYEDEDEDEDGDDDKYDCQKIKHMNRGTGEPVTELDLYKRFIGTREPLTSEPPPKVSSTPDILSTLTTTERTTLQDGTVHTKVVLKRRFADGHEECKETTHTQNPRSGTQHQPAARVINDENSTKDGSMGGKDRAEGKKGWFWS